MNDFEIKITYNKETKELSIINAYAGIYSYYDKVETLSDLVKGLQDYVEEYELIKEGDLNEIS